MSRANHQPKEPGTITSYVVGFVLSVVFTLIPYYLVVNKTVAGNQLLFTIIGFAVVQMLIQVFFFLHLGRGPKPFYNIVFFGSTVGIILVVVGGSMFIMRQLHYNMTPSETSQQVAEGEAIHQVEGTKTGTCAEPAKVKWQVKIKNGQAEPSQIYAQSCDSLTVTNQDKVSRLMAFGEHDDHATYDGVTEKLLKQDKSLTVRLTKTGQFTLHDHLDDRVKIFFTVEQ